MMKVLYLTHETELNGAQKSLLEFLPVLREKGIEPIVVVPGQGRLKEELDKIGINTQIVSYRGCVYYKEQKCGFRYYINYVIGNYTAVWKLIQIIKKENIAIIHSNSLAVDVGAIAAFLLRRPHVWHMREYLEEDFGFRTIMPRLDDYLIKKASCCIAIAKGIERKYESKYGISTVLMYNGINNLNYYSEVRAMNTNRNDMKLLLAGSLIKGKGQRDAINAVKRLSQKGRDVKLYIVGDGIPDYTLNLKKYVERNNLRENVIFEPYIADLRQMRRECDAVLVCSRMEAFGRVTAEAMMAGKIVIGASTGGTAELIGEHEERGYLYTWGNSQELADKIEYVRTHPDEVYQKEKEAQKFIINLTDMETYTERLAHIYRSFLSYSNSAKRENGIVLLLTATIAPQECRFTRLQNPGQRLRQYIDCLEYYIVHTDFKKIVLCENSAYTFQRDNLVKMAEKQGKELEILQFYGSADKIAENGKGYGEGEIVKYALENSKLLKKADYFVKITGRVKITNIDEIKKHLDIRKSYFNQCVSARKMIDTVMYCVPKKVYMQWFLDSYKVVCDKRGNFLEQVFQDVVSDNNLPIMNLPNYPIIDGISGTSGVKYQKDMGIELKIYDVLSKRNLLNCDWVRKFVMGLFLKQKR